MATWTASALIPSNLKQPFLLTQHNPPSILHKNKSMLPVVARLFGAAILEASKLKVVYLGGAGDCDLGKYLLPRTYTLTHCDIITSKLTLAISQTINTSQLQGWYQTLRRDDQVVAVWKKIKGKMSLHVYCHISGGHFLFDTFANLRYYIFRKQLPVVLKAFVHGDEKLFNKYPELNEAWAWVYFNSNIPEFNKVECWGPLGRIQNGHVNSFLLPLEIPCQHTCTCCSTNNDLKPPQP